MINFLKMNKLTVVILSCIVFLSSCANEKKFVRFYKKCTSDSGSLKKQEIPAQYCHAWFPVAKVDSVTTVVFKEGKTIEVPGETKYISVDCGDKDNSGKERIIQVKVPVYLRQDTIFSTKTVTVRDSAYEQTLIIQNRITEQKLSQQTTKTEKTAAETKKWKGRAEWGWRLFVALLILNAIRMYIKSKIP